MSLLNGQIAGLEEAVHLICHRCASSEIVLRDEETGEMYHPWGSHIDGDNVCEAYPIHDRLAELRALLPKPRSKRSGDH